MKKIFVWTGLFILFITLYAGNLYAACTVTRNKIEVSQGTGSTCSSIQSAVNAADGINPVLISVLPGTYTEHVDITKSNIIMQGVDPKFTTVAGDIYIFNSTTALNNITISGITITGGGCRINSNISEISIKNNTITGPDYGHSGIEFTYSGMGNNILIKDNIVTSATTGNGISINNNSTNVVIEGNIVKDNGSSGIYTGNSDAKIINNIVTDNGAGGGYGIHCRPNGSNKCLVKGNTVTGTGMNGIYVEGSNEIKVVDNIATGNNVIGNPSYYGDIATSSDQDTHISFNVFDSIIGIKGTNWVGNFNVKTNGDMHP